MSPQKFLACSKKALEAVKVLGRCYETELNDVKAKILFNYSSPQSHVKEYLCQFHRNFDNKTLESLNDYFQSFWCGGRFSQEAFCQQQLGILVVQAQSTYQLWWLTQCLFLHLPQQLRLWRFFLYRTPLWWFSISDLQCLWVLQKYLLNWMGCMWNA